MAQTSKQFTFGAGQLWATQLVDADGNDILNPTPIRFGTLQEASLEIAFETKRLMSSESQFPVAIANGAGKVTGTIKKGQVQGDVFASIFFGQSLTAGEYSIVYDTVGSAIPSAGPYEVTPTPPRSGAFLDDKGVSYRMTGINLKRVASAPALGEYAVDVATGKYTFAAADAGKVVFIHYNYTATSTTAKKQTVIDKPMGSTPSCRIDLYQSFNGKNMVFTLYNAVFNKFTMGTKLDDFAIDDTGFECFSGPQGIMTWGTAA